MSVHIIDLENVRSQFIQLVERKKIWVERPISTRTQIWINFLLTLVMFYIFLQMMHSINEPFSTIVISDASFYASR